jgi:hypothetical protein
LGGLYFFAAVSLMSLYVDSKPLVRPHMLSRTGGDSHFMAAGRAWPRSHRYLQGKWGGRRGGGGGGRMGSGGEAAAGAGQGVWRHPFLCARGGLHPATPSPGPNALHGSDEQQGPLEGVGGRPLVQAPEFAQRQGHIEHDADGPHGVGIPGPPNTVSQHIFAWWTGAGEEGGRLAKGSAKHPQAQGQQGTAARTVPSSWADTLLAAGSASCWW